MVAGMGYYRGTCSTATDVSTDTNNTTTDCGWEPFIWDDVSEVSEGDKPASTSFPSVRTVPNKIPKIINRMKSQAVRRPFRNQFTSAFMVQISRKRDFNRRRNGV